MQDYDANCEQSDGAKFYKSAEVVAGSQQNPYRNGGRGKGIDDDQDRQTLSAESEYMSYGGILRRPLAPPDREQNQDESRERRLQNFSGPDSPKIDSHAHRNWNRHGDGKGPPRAIFERIDDD